MAHPAHRSSCARIPLGSLGALAALRARDDVTAVVEGDHAWVFWPAGDEAALVRVLAVPAAELNVRGDDGAWRRLGERLARGDVPSGAGGAPLRAFLPVPPVAPLAAGAAAVEPATMRLVPCDGVTAALPPVALSRPTTAALVDLAVLAKWAEKATSEQLSHLHAARAGTLVVLRGSRIPALASSERFWGERVLVPLGRRLEPALSDVDVLALAGAGREELVLVREQSLEVVPESAFREVSRASVRLAARGAAP